MRKMTYLKCGRSKILCGEFYTARAIPSKPMWPCLTVVVSSTSTGRSLICPRGHEMGGHATFANDTKAYAFDPDPQ